LPCSQSIIIATPTMGLVIRGGGGRLCALVTGFFVTRFLDAVPPSEVHPSCRAVRRGVVTLRSFALVDERAHRLLEILEAIAEKPTDSGEAIALSARRHRGGSE